MGVIGIDEKVGESVDNNGSGYRGVFCGDSCGIVQSEPTSCDDTICFCNSNGVFHSVAYYLS